MSKTYCVYILASRSRNLYTGVTSNLEHRMVEHRQGLVPGFSDLLPWIRRKVYMILRNEEEGYGEGKA